MPASDKSGRVWLQFGNTEWSQWSRRLGIRYSDGSPITPMLCSVYFVQQSCIETQSPLHFTDEMAVLVMCVLLTLFALYAAGSM